MCNGGYLLWNVFILVSGEEIRLSNYFFESSFKISIWNRVILAVPTLFCPISYLWSGLEPPSLCFARFSSAAASILSDLLFPVWFPPAIFTISQLFHFKTFLKTENLFNVKVKIFCLYIYPYEDAYEVKVSKHLTGTPKTSKETFTSSASPYFFGY